MKFPLTWIEKQKNINEVIINLQTEDYSLTTYAYVSLQNRYSLYNLLYARIELYERYLLLSGKYDSI